MKKFAIAILLSAFLFTASAPYFKAKAYWNILGFKIPSNISEIKEVINRSGRNNSEDSPESDESAEATGEGQIVVHYTQDDGEEIIRKSTYEGMLAVIKITPDMINGFLDSQVEGKSYMGYTVKSVNISLYDDEAGVDLSMADGKTFTARLGLPSDGRGIALESLENTGSVKFSVIEMAVIKGLLNSAPKKLFEIFPDYK